MMLFEAIPGSAFDCWKNGMTPNEQLKIALKLLETYIPIEANRCQNVTLTDSMATLTGSFTPVIKKPTAVLNNGSLLLGMGDAIILNDPIAGQGANNATKFAQMYLQRILAHGQAKFDHPWMQETFNLYWKQHGKFITEWSNLLLTPPPPHVINLLNTAATDLKLANYLANAFDNPASLFPWILNSDLTGQFIAENFKNVRLGETIL